MKVVTWNCNGAFRRKFDRLAEFDADLYVVQECEDPNVCTDPRYKEWAENFLWIGDVKHKGLGIFAKSHIHLEELSWSNQYKDHTVKYFLPCRINDQFNLLAVWAHGNNSPTFGYIGQVWKYLQINKLIDTELVLGDFNSNVIWDKWDRWWNHTDVCAILKDYELQSLYHIYYNEEEGKESRPTLFLQKNRVKPYYVDYVFGSQQLGNSLASMHIGKIEEWLHLSDHMPICCEFKL